MGIAQEIDQAKVIKRYGKRQPIRQPSRSSRQLACNAIDGHRDIESHQINLQPEP
jgi:hypothetical protein